MGWHYGWVFVAEGKPQPPGLPGEPPGIWGPPGPWPTPPIAPGGPPLGIWGGGNLPVMGHPIAPGGPPPQVTLPIYNPGSPEHPIVLPPEEGPPPEIWPPPGPLPHPGNPMVPEAEHIFVVGYAPGYGVCWVRVKPEPIEEAPPVATPYAKKG